MTFLLPLYRTISTVGAPAINWYFQQRIKNGKEDRLRFGERKGFACIPRPSGSLIWVHGASVGESITVLPLIEKLRQEYPGINVLITTGTVSSGALLEKRLPDEVIHQYVPIDRPPYVCRFLDHWRPDLALWVESEFWPNLITMTNDRNIPQVLINGRISPSSYAEWKYIRGLIRRMLECFDLCMAQGEIDSARLCELGAKQVKTPGNLKYASPELPVDLGNLDFLRQKIDTRPCWFAASTHPGEEDIISDVHFRVSRSFPNLITILAPRHPDRGKKIAEKLALNGHKVSRRSAGESIYSDTNIYLADTMGELGLFFRLSPVSFIGKSLVDMGGQNPLEPARLKSAVLVGPHMWNFPDITETLLLSGAAELVTDSGSLAAALDRLLRDLNLCRSRGEIGQRVAKSHNSILQKVNHELRPFIETAQTKYPVS